MRPGEMYPCAVGSCRHRIIVQGFALYITDDEPPTDGVTVAAVAPAGDVGYKIELYAPDGEGGALRRRAVCSAMLDPEASPDGAGDIVEVRRGPFGNDQVSCPLLDDLSYLFRKALITTGVCMRAEAMQKTPPGAPLQVPAPIELAHACEATMAQLDRDLFAALLEVLRLRRESRAASSDGGGYVH